MLLLLVRSTHIPAPSNSYCTWGSSCIYMYIIANTTVVTVVLMVWSTGQVHCVNITYIFFLSIQVRHLTRVAQVEQLLSLLEL